MGQFNGRRNIKAKNFMSQVKLETFKQRVSFLYKSLAKYKVYIGLLLVLELIISLLSAVIPYFTKLQIDQLQNPSNAFFGLTVQQPFTIFIIALLVPIVIEIFRQYVLERVNRVIVIKFESKLDLAIEKIIWKKFKNLDAGFFANKRNSRLIVWIFNGRTVARESFSFLRQRLGNIVTLGAIIPLLGLVSWQLMIIVAVVTVLQMLLNDLMRKQELALSLLAERQRERFWKIDQALTDHFQTLNVLGAAETFLDQYQQLTEKRALDNVKNDQERERLQIWQTLLGNFLTVAVNLYVGWQALQGTISIGTFSLVISYTFQLNGIFRNLLESVKQWQEINLSFDRLDFFFSLKPRVKSVKNPIQLINTTEKIELKSVSFTYPDFYEEERKYIEMMISKTKAFMQKSSSYYLKYELRDWEELLKSNTKSEEVLRDVSLNLEKGKITALLGRNGAGKTTITQLLLHQYEPNTGEIFLNDTEVFKYEQNALLKQFSIIQQHPFILDQFSVRENLLLGMQREVTDNEIWELLEEIGLKNKFKSLAKGLDTIIGEDTSFSGGQEQLLAVARVLLQKRPIIIFDEGTNQMDIEHETKVVELLKRQKKNSAILFITHRITTARKADAIYMLDKGVIVEKGTHSELLAQKGLYATFWNMQVIE